jgi:hypothetical protein
VPTSVLRMPTGVITATILILGVSAICIAVHRLSSRQKPVSGQAEGKQVR